MLSKWKKAVVHLECATDKTLLHERHQQFQRLLEAKRQGLLTLEKLQESASDTGREVRRCGTGLLLSHLTRRYLVTAHHVVWDDYAALGALKAALSAGAPDDDSREFTDAELESIDKTNIYPMIYRIPSPVEGTAINHIPAFLMNLGAGAPASRAYTFDPVNDLAVISLDTRERFFADELDRLGYESISSDLLADGPAEEGQPILTVGFPSSVSFVEHREQHPIVATWKSPSLSLPTFAFGHVSMLHESLSYFWADISSYPGNSGGPVIADGRVVGLVSRQAQTVIDQLAMAGSDDPVAVRIPFGKMIKGGFIRALLDHRHRQDLYLEETFRMSP